VTFIVGCGIGMTGVRADNQTYTEQFQNNTTSLSGKSVETNMYFTKMDYWDIKKATFNLTYQISQLAETQKSDITVSINGVKFYSFRPHDGDGFQTEQISIPVELLTGENNLQISGQVLNKAGNSNYDLAQTPANWLTIKQGSNVNFEYQLKDADNTLHSFYNHFSGEDTVANGQSRIVTANHPSGDELTASMIALSGESRVITTDNDQIQVVKQASMNAQQGDYLMVVATYRHLPKELRNAVSATEVAHHAVIKTHYADGKHYLIVTAQTGKLLKKAARFVANAELMNETNKATETVGSRTRTFTSSLHDQGHYQLTDQTDKIIGAGHRETSYFVSLPNDRSNADGSTVKLHLRYSKNLNFNRSLVTVYVNNTTIGSKKLTAVHANGDTLTVKVPNGMTLGSSFTVRVAFDLEMKDQNTSDNSATPWAEVGTSSKMTVKSQKSNELLFTNYPTLFMKNQTYDNLAVVIPKKLSNDDFQSLTNIFNLIGNFAKSNTGSIQFYTHQPSQHVLKTKNVIVLGTPQNNHFIRTLNSHLYFKYAADFTRLISNEKLSIEKDYGKTIGTAQLMRSPYNSKRGMLVVTGATSKASYLATTQINFQKNITQYSGDAIVVDQNNSHYGYRFKKNKAIDKSLERHRLFSKNTSLLIYLGLALVVMALVCLGIFLMVKKQRGLNTRRNPHAK
jgi:cellulose synthase (UDP-forming)